MLIIESPWTRQPQGAVQLNPALPLPTMVYVGSQALTIPRGQPLVPPALRPLVATERGIALAIDAGAGGSAKRYQVDSSNETIFRSGSTATIAVLRRSRDTTARTATLFHTESGASNRVLLHAPFSDGNCYWDFGNATNSSGGGRISVAFGAKVTTWETIVVVAGPSKGREIWRNGIKLAGDTSRTAARPTSSVPFYVGTEPNTGNESDNEDIALIVVSVAEWSSSFIRSWCDNPYGATFAPQQIIIPTPAAAGYTHPTLSLATATEITATGFKPRVTYTFA